MTDLVDDNSNNPAPAGTVTPVVTPTIDAPITMTPVSAGDISTPNNLARVASGSIGLPTEFTPVGAGTISTPNALSRVSAGDISAPNTLSRVAAGDISAPNTLNRIAASSVSTPNTLTPVAAQHINRALKPIISFDFGNQTYSKDGQPQTFADITTFTRASTATFVETYIDNLSRKQKRIATAAVNTPRFEEDGLLVEGASTNLHINSENFAQPAWTATDAETILNIAKSPDGLDTADKLQANSTGSLAPRIFDTFSGLTDGSSFTASIFVKPVDVLFFQLRFSSGDVTGNPRANFNLATGTIGSVDPQLTAKIEPFSDGWFRISVSGVIVGTDITPVYQLINSENAANGASSSFVDGQGVLVWGGQIEQLPFATSYIKTQGSPVSRAADIIESDLGLNQASGSMHVKCKALGVTDSVNQNILSWGNSTTNIVWLILSSNGDLRSFISNNGINQADLNTSGINVDSSFTLSTTFSNNNVKQFVNGVETASDNAAIIPINLIDFSIGSANNSSSNPFYGIISHASVFYDVLTANEVKYL